MHGSLQGHALLVCCAVLFSPAAKAPAPTRLVKAGTVPPRAVR